MGFLISAERNNSPMTGTMTVSSGRQVGISARTTRLIGGDATDEIEACAGEDTNGGEYHE